MILFKVSRIEVREGTMYAPESVTSQYRRFCQEHVSLGSENRAEHSDEER